MTTTVLAAWTLELGASYWSDPCSCPPADGETGHEERADARTRADRDNANYRKNSHYGLQTSPAAARRSSA